MGDAPKSVLASVDLKDMLQNDQTAGNGDGLLWENVLVAKAGKNLKNKRPKVAMLRKTSTIGVGHKSKRSARILVRRARLEGSRRRRDGMERKVNTLKRLIPKIDHSTGLDGLFKETADYILSLQTRVRVMQFMVDSFSCFANDDHSIFSFNTL